MHAMSQSSRSRKRRWQEDQEVKFEKSDMIPKSGKSSADSRKSVGIHEFAALARSSLNGISQAVRDHVTKPTSLAQGRVAHLIEWKGWPKPANTPQAAHFSSYCHLSEGEKEARFAAGVAEQFAIAEAKLRAWASVDEDDADEEDSNDEDAKAGSRADFPPRSTADSVTCDPTCPARIRREGIFQEEGNGGEVCVHHKPEWRPGRFDSCYSTSHSESPGEEDEEEGEDEVFQEARAWSSDRFPLDRASSSGVASLDEEDQENQEQGGDKLEDKEYLM